MAHDPPTSTSELKKVQQLQFQTSGVLLFMGVQRLYGPKISRFLPCMLQYLDNLWQLFIFSSYLKEIDHSKVRYLTLDLLKSFS